MLVVLLKGPMGSSTLSEIPDDAQLLYCTFADSGDTVRWTAWTADMPPDTMPALQVDEGQNVYVYKMSEEMDPNVQILDNEEIKTAVAFQYLARSIAMTEEVTDDATSIPTRPSSRPTR